MQRQQRPDAARVRERYRIWHGPVNPEYDLSPLTNADVIIAALGRAGVQRLIGMPGGGSTADLIEAARLSGLPFTLAHTETGSAFIAAAQAEIAGTPAACVA